jgi:chemotaxis protein MotA
MDLATLIGLGSGTAIVLVAILLGGDFMSFVDVPSLLLVIGGSIAATVLRFTLADVLTALKTGISAALGQSRTTPRVLIQEITELAQKARKGGLIGLDGIEITDDFLKKGVQLCVDGLTFEFIKDALSRDRDLYIERHEEGERIFRAIGDAAPAFGMIGTLVGLVQMLGNMEDPQTIGPAMAIALLTTLYGALISNLIALPIADKLASKAQIEYVRRTLVIEGTLHIQNKTNPDVMFEFLSAYLPENQREAPAWGRPRRRAAGRPAVAKHAGPAGAPLWMVTFADLMSLLVCFFVLLISFSVPDTKKLKIVAGSIRDAFGFQREIVVTGMVEIDGNPRYEYASDLVPLPIKELIGPIPDNNQEIRELSQREAAFEELREILDPFIIDWPSEPELAAAIGEDRRFRQTAAALRQAIQSIPELERLAEHLVIERAPEGLRIQIVDQARTSMFPLGSAQMYPPTRMLLSHVAARSRTCPTRSRSPATPTASPSAAAIPMTTGRSRSIAPTPRGARWSPRASTQGGSRRSSARPTPSTCSPTSRSTRATAGSASRCCARRR